jgi:hypothetical protein
LGDGQALEALHHVTNGASNAMVLATRH